MVPTLPDLLPAQTLPALTRWTLEEAAEMLRAWNPPVVAVLAAFSALAVTRGDFVALLTGADLAPSAVPDLAAQVWALLSGGDRDLLTRLGAQLPMGWLRYMVATSRASPKISGVPRAMANH